MAQSGDRGKVAPHRPSITPVFPLILLETMRDMDRPEELLEGENLAVSLPRRLGLSDVVYTQIHRFREEVRRKRLQTPAAVEDLMRLVIRRPDAERIFEEAGRRLARHAWAERSAGGRRLTRLLPPVLAMRSARKAAHRLFRRVVGDAALQVLNKPAGLRLTGSMTGRADPVGAACAFYTGALAELMSQYTGRRHSAEHVLCEATGGAACEWRVLVVA